MTTGGELVRAGVYAAFVRTPAARLSCRTTLRRKEAPTVIDEGEMLTSMTVGEFCHTVLQRIQPASAH